MTFKTNFSRYLQFYIDHVFNIDEWGDWIDNTKEMIDSSAYYDMYRTLDYGFTYDDFTKISADSSGMYFIKMQAEEFLSTQKIMLMK